MKPRSATVVVAALVALLSGLAPGTARAAEGSTIFGKHVQRDGLHFQVAFGWGGGTPGAGVFHNMELGGTFANGMTLAYEHTFIQLGGFAKGSGKLPDLIGGHLLAWKIPLIFRDLVLRLAIGPGGTHDQTDGIDAAFGLGWSYGLDLHLPLFDTSGLTLGFSGIHVVTARDGAHAGWALSLGYTWF